MNLVRIFDYRFWITALLSSSLGLVLITASSLFDKKPLLLLAWPVSVLFLIFMVVQPKWTAVIILLIRPLLDLVLNMTKVSAGGDSSMGIGAVVNLVVIFLAIFLAFYTFSFPSKIAPVYSWVIFLVLMLISASYSSYPGQGIRLCFDYFSYFAMFIIPFLIIKTPEHFLFWLKIFGISFILPVLYANIDLMHGGHYFPDAGMRIMGTFTHPNILAFYLVLGFTFYFYVLKSGFLSSKPWLLFLIKLLMIDMLVLLVATKTRNAWIAAYAGFIIYGLLKDLKVLALLVGIVPLLMLIPDVAHRVNDVWGHSEGSSYHGVNSLAWRLELWKSAWVKILDRPFQGYGLASFQPSTEIFFPSAKDMHAHNSYVEVLFETGIIGLSSFLVLFLTPLVIFFKKMLQAVHKTQARIWAVMVGYLISYMLISSADNLTFYLTFNWYVWFFMGLMLVAVYRHYPIMKMER